MIETRLRTVLSTTSLCLLAVFSVACGAEEEPEEDGGNIDGTVTDEWADYCVATFTEDYEVLDVFDDVEFTAKEGESYLIADLDGFFGDVELFFMTPTGVDGFAVSGEGELPFTTDCSADTSVSYTAAFTDVTVYTSEALDEVLCEIEAGDVKPGSSNGYFLAGDISFDGPAIYEVDLGGFSSDCGDAESGFVSVPETKIRSTTTWLIPIQTISGPPVD